MGIRRAGADFAVTYFAKEAAKLLGSVMGRYDVQWKNYRRLRLAHRIGTWGFFLFFSCWSFHLIYGISVPFLIIQIYVLLFAVISFRFYFFRCPRRHRFFAMTWRYTPMLWARECVHCGLRRFSDGDNEDE